MQDQVYDSMQVGLEGQLADSGPHDIGSYINNSKQHFTVTVTAADLETVVTINGTAFTANAGSGSKTKPAIAAEMVGVINAGSEPVTATEASGQDYLFVEADVAGTAFTCVGTTNCTVVEDVPNEAGVNFGLCVVQDVNVTPAGNTDNLAHLPNLVAQITDTNRALGVAVHTQALEQALLNADNVGYPLGSTMSVLRKGRVWVRVEDAVVVGGQPYVRCIAGAGERLGAFRSDADGSDAGALPGSRYKTSAGAGELAIVEINLPIT